MIASRLVPGARVELAWISPNDFESLLSPASRCNFNSIQELELPNFPMAVWALASHKRTGFRRAEPFSFRLFSQKCGKHAWKEFSNDSCHLHGILTENEFAWEG